MATDVTPKPINWKDVAIVVFDGDRPIIITSAEPRVLFDTFLSLVEDEKNEDCLWPDTSNERIGKILKAIEKYRWELHTTEQAKRLFCDAYNNEKEG